MKAFPSENDANKEYNWKEPGMDLRDCFAMFAMLGLISKRVMSGFETQVVSKEAYEMADAMMKAREAK